MAMVIGLQVCHHCLVHQRQMMDMLFAGGSPPEECGGCCRKIAEMEFDAGGNIQMTVQSKDGIYQMLCPSCTETYEQKRADLYGLTPYGHEKGIGR